MGVRVYESMTRVPLIAHEPALRRGWTPKVLGCVRIWREEATLAAACAPDRSDIFSTMEALPEGASHQEIIEALEQLPRIAAVEVTDDCGNGALLYPNWE